MSKVAVVRREGKTRLARFALCFEFQTQHGDVGLSRACVERNDNVTLETLVEHFQLILPRYQGLLLCTCYVVCHDVGIVVHY